MPIQKMTTMNNDEYYALLQMKPHYKTGIRVVLMKISGEELTNKKPKSMHSPSKIITIDNFRDFLETQKKIFGKYEHLINDGSHFARAVEKYLCS